MRARLCARLFLAGLFAIPCVAQSQSQSQSQPAPDANSAAPATTNSGSTSSAPKKVWTNEDIPSAKLPADKRSQNATAPKQTTADAATVDRIRKSLQKLQGQLDDVNKQLKSYNDFTKGEAVSSASREVNKGVNREPVDQQVAQLQEKKKQLESQIGDLYDEARKKGIDPGQLRDTASAGL
jgi:hypothetical protein